MHPECWPCSSCIRSNPVTLLPVVFACGVSRPRSAASCLLSWGRSVPLHFGGGSFLAGGEASVQPPSLGWGWEFQVTGFQNCSCRLGSWVALPGKTLLVKGQIQKVGCSFPVAFLGNVSLTLQQNLLKHLNFARAV